MKTPRWSIPDHVVIFALIFGTVMVIAIADNFAKAAKALGGCQ
jgi:hypothetical protein